MPRTDFLVIGAGIAGAAAGWALAPHGRVTLLEREDQPGYHSTGRSAAMFIEAYGNLAIRRLVRASGRFLRQPPPGFTDHPILTPRGVLFIAPEHQRRSLDALLAQMSDVGDSLRPIDADEAVRLVPILKRDFVAAAMQTDAEDIDVHALHGGYLKVIKSHGGQVVCGAEVTALARRGGEWRASTPAGEFSAPVVVNAAGAWADRIAALAGVACVGLQPMRRTAFTFDPPAGLDVRALPLCTDVEEQFYFKPDAGRFLGSLSEETPSDPCDAQADDMDVALAVDRIERAITFKVRRVHRSWAGLRSFVADRTLVIGPTKAAEGFVWMAGQGGYGIETSPAAGKIAAALALGHELPADLRGEGIDAADLSPDRAGLGQALRAHARGGVGGRIDEPS
jgi:D-arginine dehydrogenase